MKKLIIAIVVLTLTSCNSTTHQTAIDEEINSKEPYLVFTQEKKQSFGKVSNEKQQYVDVEFEFENKGEKPLIILKADVSCGCLNVDYTKKPLKKGEKGHVKVKIDTKSQDGDFNKTVYIKSNATNKTELLRIVGKIK